MKNLVGATIGAVVGLSAAILHAAPISGQGTWERTLQVRDLDNDGVIDAYFDTAQNITWLKDATYAATTGVTVDGRMSWDNANVWTSGLKFGGFSGWRLPKGAPDCIWGDSGTNCDYKAFSATSEISYLYLMTLGNKTGSSPVLGPSCLLYCLSNTGPFENLINDRIFWTGAEYPSFSSYAWYFNPSIGISNINPKEAWFAVWAVADGDVGAANTVAEPPSALLAGLALGGLAMGINRRGRN